MDYETFHQCLLYPRVQIRPLLSQAIISISVYGAKKKPWQAAISPFYRAMTAQLRTCALSRPPGAEWAWLGLQEEGRVRGYGGKGDTMADYGKSQYAGPSQWSCTDGEPTDSGPCVDWDGFGVEVDVEGKGRQEGHWQPAHPRWRGMSAASCHVVFVVRWKT